MTVETWQVETFLICYVQAADYSFQNFQTHFFGLLCNLARSQMGAYAAS